MRPAEGTNVSGSSALMRHSMEWPEKMHFASGVVQSFARGDANLRFHQVHAGDKFGDGMLHLNARVHFDEIDASHPGPSGTRRCRRWCSRCLPALSRPWRPVLCGAWHRWRAKAILRAASGAAAGWCIRARRDGLLCRAGRPAPEIRCGGDARGISPCTHRECRRPAALRCAPSGRRSAVRRLLRTTRMPRPPPPAAAFRISG